jgi:hypothetical protein
MRGNQYALWSEPKTQGNATNGLWCGYRGLYSLTIVQTTFPSNRNDGGVTLRNEGKYAEALVAFDQAIQFDPQFALPHVANPQLLPFSDWGDVTKPY